MSADLIEDIVDWIVRAISSLGFFLPVLIYLIFSFFGGDRKKQEQSSQPRQGQARQAGPSAPQARPANERAPRPPREAMPFPLDPAMWVEVEPSAPQPERPRRDDPWRRETPRREDAYRRQDDTLQWGSAFAANDREKAASAFKWGSVFDEPRERTRWGWDETEWGGDYAPRPSSEPKITVG